MKSILFDVDGVFLSEDRCFDVAALTVYEILMSSEYIGLHPSIDFSQLTEEDIKEIRELVFYQDEILQQLKSMGLNSNWDMLFIVLALHTIEICKSIDPRTLQAFLESETISGEALQFLGQHVNEVALNFESTMKFLKQVKHGENEIFEALQAHAQAALYTDKVDMFEMSSSYWQLAQEIYQEWYLGRQLFEEVEGKAAKSTFKEGYIYHEVVLAPVTDIQILLQDLVDAGYQLALATGRPRTETEVPFQSLGLSDYFDKQHVVTASDVLKAEQILPEQRPLAKPNPFTYLAAYFGNDVSKYSQYAQDQAHRLEDEEVYIVGDSLADLLCAKKIGATFIGPLTGLKGKDAKAELEDNDADYIVDDVLQIINILL
ncbi:HAD hydrolase-like protein [Staphylococcus pettenkoferi]|uniref:HAD family hydrolase n=1 Tax=Staphylococcus pettenkoferi TaxID=170573 RepID=UPI0022746EA9|nr:HAD hydrolase-like protein [Staphylococcus pettenkoferi]MCY1608188.1 HAD hydrolase-like protein [Staphylococcus pettenkoferi]